MTRLRWWLRRNKISYERAAGALEWKIERLKNICKNRVWPTEEEMDDVKDYTFDEVAYKHWFRVDFEKARRKERRQRANAKAREAQNR